MFTPEDRERIRADILARARLEPRITGAAITGSASAGREDRWSDIDLAFGVSSDLDGVLAGFTRAMYGDHAAVHHVDVHAGPWVYRVFLLASTLQVDLAFVPEAHFCARSPTFQLVFGTAAAADHRAAPPASELVGMAWLYALHVRSASRRGRRWQALHMLDCMRDHVLALASLRHGGETAHARGVDALPVDVLRAYEPTIAHGLDDVERAFVALAAVLADETARADAALAARVAPVLAAIARG